MQPPKATAFNIDISADLNKWRAFVAIGELGSLTRAALFLDSNQSLLSRQLNALERECGARLFTRTGRGVEERMRELAGLAGGFLVTLVEREGRLAGTDLSRAGGLVEGAP